jgi:hypothetical protein
VTVKHGNRVGDLVGIVIQDSEEKKSAISLEEAEELVSQNKIEGLKLETYKISDTDGKVIGGGNLIFFENGKPILFERIEWHHDLAMNKDIIFSEKVNEAINNSCYR